MCARTSGNMYKPSLLPYRMYESYHRLKYSRRDRRRASSMLLRLDCNLAGNRKGPTTHSEEGLEGNTSKVDLELNRSRKFSRYRLQPGKTVQG
jgi:hypothetical protein